MLGDRFDPSQLAFLHSGSYPALHVAISQPGSSPQGKCSAAIVHRVSAVADVEVEAGLDDGATRGSSVDADFSDVDAADGLAFVGDVRVDLLVVCSGAARAGTCFGASSLRASSALDDACAVGVACDVESSCSPGGADDCWLHATSDTASTPKRRRKDLMVC
jgi:hypothetical protein